MVALQRLLGRTPPVSDVDPDVALRVLALARLDNQAARLRALDIHNEVQAGKLR